MKKLLVALILTTVGLAVIAEEQMHIAPFQYGIIVDEISLEPSTTRINGWATGIWIENPQSALATSLFNGSTGDSKGLSIGIINYAENYSGAQFALVNYVKGNFTGWQKGGFNYTKGTCKGLQSGFYNITSEMYGVQLGLINTSSKLYGLQIGLINLNISNKFLTELPSELSPGMPIVNWKF